MTFVEDFMFIELAYLGKNNFWRYLVSILIILALLVIGNIPMVAVLIVAQFSHPDVKPPTDPTDLSMYDIDSNVTLALMLVAFAIGLVGVWISVRFIHQRSFLSVVTTRPRIDMQRVLFSAALWFGLTLGAELVFYALHPANYSLQFDAQRFIPLFFIAVILIPFQSSLEEVLLRGYLLQGFGLLLRFRWLAILTTSLIFGILHIGNPEISKYGFLLTMPFYVTFGIAAAIITIMDDGMEITLGMHAINNIYGAVIVTFPSSALQTHALIHNAEYLPLGMLIAWFVTATIFILVLHRKYQWTNWSRLYSRIRKPEPPAMIEPASSFISHQDQAPQVT